MNRLAAPLVLLACCAGCGSATKRSSLSSEISTRESLTSAVIAGSGRPSPDMTFAPTTASTSTVPVDTSWLEPFATEPPLPAVPEGWQPRRRCHSVDAARLEGGRSPGMAGVRRRDGDVPPRGRHRRQRRGTRCGRGPRHVHNVGLTTRAAGRSARGHVRLESRHVRRRHRRPAAKIRPTRSGPSGSEAGFLSRPGHMPIRLVRCRLPADLGGQLAAGHCGELCGLARLADPGGRRRVDPRPRRSGSDPGRDQWQDRPP